MLLLHNSSKQQHAHTLTHIFNAHFPGKLRLASCLLDFSSPFVPVLCVLLRPAKTFYVILDTVPPDLAKTSPPPSSINLQCHTALDPIFIRSVLHKQHSGVCLCVQSQLRQTRDQGQRRHIRDDMKSLRRELRHRESSAVSDIVRQATVVLATLTSASDDGPLGALDGRKFDVVVIDECSQVVLSVMS